MWGNRSWCWPARAGGLLLGEGVACFIWNNTLCYKVNKYIIWFGSGLLYFNESHTHGSISVSQHSLAGNIRIVLVLSTKHYIVHIRIGSLESHEI